MGKHLKIGVAGIIHETNSFAPGITEMDAFQRRSVQGKKAFYDRHMGTKTPMGGAIDAAQHNDVELIPGFHTGATPSGMVSAAAVEQLIQSVVDSVPDQLDGLLLILHGAMVSETYADVELEIVKRLRRRFSDSFPIGVTLDLHANISEEFINGTDIVVGYNTYPHVDTYETAVKAIKLLAARARNQIQPYSHWRHSRMLVAPQAMITDEGAMNELMQRAAEMEQQPDVLNVMVAGGFPYSDIPDAGLSFVVTTDGDTELAKTLTKELCSMAWERRERFKVCEYSVEEAIEKSLATNDGPDIFIEASDNVGGGAPADATHTLKHLIHLDQKSLIVIRDAKAALLAHQQGIGTILECCIGGHSDVLHGESVQIKGKIRLLFDGVYHHRGLYMTGQQMNMGITAVVEVGHLTIVLTENRSAPYDIGLVHSVGINPQDFKIIVVKSAVAWRTAFGSIAKQKIFLDTPGACSANLDYFTYKKLNRPRYPLDKVVLSSYK